MSFPCTIFLETAAMFLEFVDDLDNLARGSSSVGENLDESNNGLSSQPSTTSTPKRCAQSRLLEFEHYVVVNRQIMMTIAPSEEKPISPHAVRFSYACWVDVGREYLEVVKGSLHRFFVFDFNDQAINRFVEHHTLTIFKEFLNYYHRHFRKYSNLDEARANPPHLLSNHGRTKLIDRKQPYNHSSGYKSFLQRQHELSEQRRESVDRVELFRNSHLRQDIVSKFVAEKNTRTSVPTYPRGTQVEGPQDDECEQIHDVMSVIHSRALITGLSLIKLCNDLKSRQEITKR
uniref:CACTA en-spm transposon protein n=1 Tax=Cucumis melo TaxID=3656 RepID=A0A9I9E8B2_CUCME